MVNVTFFRGLLVSPTNCVRADPNRPIREIAHIAGFGLIAFIVQPDHLVTPEAKLAEKRITAPRLAKRPVPIAAAYSSLSLSSTLQPGQHAVNEPMGARHS
jgi:hypothetical protein